jgi:ribonucleotide reductase alpha subunit
MIAENKASKYILYAIGEIVLVVIGILIALSINNNNEDKKARKLEVKYLKNLQTDIGLELKNNDSIIKYRLLTAEAASKLLNFKPLENATDILNLEITINQVYARKTFIPTNNTYKELLSSGNLNYITNDSIKEYLMELDKMYVQIDNSEYHMYREYEEYLYNTSVENAEMLNLFDFQETAENGELVFVDPSEIPIDSLIPQYESLFQKNAMKNGLKLAVMNNVNLKNLHTAMISHLEKLNQLLVNDIKKD